jgi:Icc-related predicted phosphoesterase
MKILVVSDQVNDLIYSPGIKERFGDVDLVLSCGDLPYSYLEFIIDALNVPLLYVRGNHAVKIEYSSRGDRTSPWGAIDLHRTSTKVSGLLIAGFEGSIRYRRGNYQYSQIEMWGHVIGIIPRMIYNRLRYGRYLDILVTHSPPFGINDDKDRAHVGFNAFRWFLKMFTPRYHFHGHVHVYNSAIRVKTMFHSTEVINAYGYFLQDYS